MKDDDQLLPGEDDDRHSLAALSVFCELYAPATREQMTDLFSTKEIQQIVKDHVGFQMHENEIYQLLTEMKYTYQLEENIFMWMVKKEK